MQLKREDHRIMLSTTKNLDQANSFQITRSRIRVSKKYARLDIVSKNVDEEVEMLGQEVFVGDGNRHGTQLSKYFP